MELFAPVNITSFILAPRRLFTDCSPKTHLTASEILDLPDPFGPTTAVIWLSNFIIVFSAKDLKPLSSILSSLI